MNLVRGIGSPGEGACWMSALHYHTRTMTDHSWSDRPAYVPETIRELAVRLNDWCEDGEREWLIGDHLFEPVGCDPSPASEMRRLEIIVGAAITWTLRMYREPSYGAWAECWLSGEDRSMAAAEDAASAAAAADAAAALEAGTDLYTTAADAAAVAVAAAAAAVATTSKAMAAAAAMAAVAAPTKLLLFGLILRCCAVGDRVEVCASRSRESVLEALETGVF